MFKNFFASNKVAILIASATLAIIIGGVFLFSKSPSQVTPKKVDNKLLIEADSEKIGSAGAQLTLVEFGDYQCPACGDYHPMIERLLSDFSGRINFIFRNFPLSQHANAKISSYAAEAAGLQGKFEEMHNKIYETQNNWTSSKDARSIFIGYAKDLGLDVDKFTKDIDSETIKQKIARDTNDGLNLQITETPTLYLNGVKLVLTGKYDDLKKTVQAELDKNSSK